MSRPLAAAVLGLAALSGCTPASRQEAAPTSAPQSLPLPSPGPAVTTLTCAGAIDGEPPLPNYETVLGVVALPTSPGNAALQAYPHGDLTVPALFAKTGLLVRAGRPSEIDVVPREVNRVAIGWGNTVFRPSVRFVVPACPDSYGTGWLAYPGGFWADRPLCLPLTVRAAGREDEVQVGVGAACPGQAPPPSG